jgi:hypothetical protein
MTRPATTTSAYGTSHTEAAWIGPCTGPDADLWIIDGVGRKALNEGNTAAGRTCLDKCPHRAQCAAGADPRRDAGTIRGAVAYVLDKNGHISTRPFRRCARTWCHHVFAATRVTQEYCTETCQRAEDHGRLKDAA